MMTRVSATAKQALLAPDDWYTYRYVPGHTGEVQAQEISTCSCIIQIQPVTCRWREKEQ